jgi:hypothetical protein
LLVTYVKNKIKIALDCPFKNNGKKVDEGRRRIKFVSCTTYFYNLTYMDVQLRIKKRKPRGICGGGGWRTKKTVAEVMDFTIQDGWSVKNKEKKIYGGRRMGGIQLTTN